MSLADGFSVFSTRFLGIFIEAAPFLLLGTLTSGLIEVFVRRDDLPRLLPRHPVLAALAGGLLGFAFPVCECGVVPVTRRLYHKGLPPSAGIVFLLASPVINPIVIAGTVAAFHQRFPELVYWRAGIALGVAVSVGLLFSLQRHPERLFLAPVGPEGIVAGLADMPPASRMTLLPGLRRALALAADEFFEMGRYLVLGALLAAGAQFIVTQRDLQTLAADPLASVLAMQGLAFLLSICSTADAFVALGFAGSVTPGGLLAFLTFGPMVDVKSTLLFLSVFRRRAVLYLILLPLAMTALAAVWINLNIAF